MEKYEVISTLGRGAGGIVSLAREKNSARYVAIKKVTLDPRKREREAVLKEASLLAHLKHPHVVALQESFFDPAEEQLFIVQKKSSFPEEQIMQWFVQMAMGLRHIHSKKVLHRDLKPQNVFLTKKGVVKIGDFGIAKMMENTFDMAKTCCGTPFYLSPELCQDMPYSSKADIWALGCLLFEMCALRHAFEAANLVSLSYKIMKMEYGEVPSQYSSSLATLIKQLLTKSPDDRPSAGTLLNHPFVQEHLAAFIKEKENIQEALHAKLLLNATPGNRNKSPNMKLRPSSAEGQRKSSNQNGNVARARCKSAQSTRRAQPAVSENEEADHTKQDNDVDEYPDDFEELDDEDDFDEESQKRPISFATLEEKEQDYEYADDFEEDSEEEILDDILANARAAKDAEVEEEEIIEDLESPVFCKQKLKEEMINVIGEQMFEEVREKVARGKYDDDQSSREFEKLDGSDMMRTCYLVNELFIQQEEQI
ncbi:serine/threonine-protein kinase Nek5-like isoform X3 [Acropora palmata]|uniref:serine/threonine-protein kinase Nek5-like isoform X3 n=1 Tax=Acropora palmata TaxID=6131 RepID=UPI003D9FF9E2